MERSDIEVLKDNWNRIAYISKKNNKIDKAELTIRINFQNNFATAKTKEELEKSIRKIRIYDLYGII